MDLDELFRWIDDHEITRQKKNLNRDFSDAVPLAEILKKHYPKLIEMHNYAPRNAVSQKMINWEILNKKVLNKLKINLNYSEKEELAKAVPGAIEKLLLRIKQKIEKNNNYALDKINNENNNNEKFYYLEGLSNEEATEEGVLDIKVKVGSRTSSQKLLPVDLYNKMERDLLEKSEEVEKLQDKVEHLESMIKIKDERINDLTRQLQKIANGDGDNIGTSSKRFFNKLF